MFREKIKRHYLILSTSDHATLKDGRTISLDLHRGKIDRDRYPDEPDTEVWVARARLNGTVIAYAEFYRDWGSIENVMVTRNYRRLGVATALYDFIERHFHIKLQPSSGRIEPDGLQFWKNRRGY